MYRHRPPHRRLPWSLCRPAASLQCIRKSSCIRNSFSSCTRPEPYQRKPGHLLQPSGSSCDCNRCFSWTKKHLGYVTIGDGALYPGAAVQKELPPVGDIHVTGIVNTAGLLEQLTLQTTRLSTVIHLADKITQGILAMIPSAMHESYFIQKL